MGWEEAAEEPAFAGSIDQYLGEELQFSRAGDAFELRRSGALLGRLTRPTEAYLAEARDGSWEFSHPRRSAGRIDACEAAGGAVVARYRRKLLGSGGVITASAGASYSLSRVRPEWHLTARRGKRVMTLLHRRSDDEIDLVPLAQRSHLSLLALLSAYVLLLTDQGVPGLSPDVPGLS